MFFKFHSRALQELSVNGQKVEDEDDESGLNDNNYNDDDTAANTDNGESDINDNTNQAAETPPTQEEPPEGDTGNAGGNNTGDTQDLAGNIDTGADGEDDGLGDANYDDTDEGETDYNIPDDAGDGLGDNNYDDDTEQDAGDTDTATNADNTGAEPANIPPDDQGGKETTNTYTGVDNSDIDDAASDSGDSGSGSDADDGLGDNNYDDDGGEDDDGLGDANYEDGGEGEIQSDGEKAQTDDGIVGEDEGGAGTPLGSNIAADLKTMEDEIFADLSDQQKDIRDNELRQGYIQLYGVIDEAERRINNIIKNENTGRILEFITRKMNELKGLIHHNLTNVYDTRTYTENQTALQECIAIMNSICNMLDAIVKEDLTRKAEFENESVYPDEFRVPRLKLM